MLIVPVAFVVFTFLAVSSGDSAPKYPNNNHEKNIGGAGKITRHRVIERANSWVQRQIPYSQSLEPDDLVDGYRSDCSGMVSMAWNSTTDGGGHWTGNMQEICYNITKDEMQKGDVMLYPGTHVLMFDHWLDDNDHFYEYAEHTYGQNASYDMTSWTNYASQGYFPCRYIDIL